MSLVGDIGRAFLGPKHAMRRQINAGVQEPQTLFYAMLFGAVNLLAQTPALYHRAQVVDQEFAGLFAAQFATSLFFMPLAMFALASVIHLVLIPFKAQASWAEARRSFVWPALVTSPFVLATGLAAVLTDSIVVKIGFAIATSIVFVWQWCSCVSEAEFGEKGQVSQ